MTLISGDWSKHRPRLFWKQATPSPVWTANPGYNSSLALLTPSAPLTPRDWHTSEMQPTKQGLPAEGDLQNVGPCACHSLRLIPHTGPGSPCHKGSERLRCSGQWALIQTHPGQTVPQTAPHCCTPKRSRLRELKAEGGNPFIPTWIKSCRHHLHLESGRHGVKPFVWFSWRGEVCIGRRIHENSSKCNVFLNCFVVYSQIQIV